MKIRWDEKFRIKGNGGAPRPVRDPKEYVYFDDGGQASAIV